MEDNKLELLDTKNSYSENPQKIDEGLEFSSETDKIIPAFINFQKSIDVAVKSAGNSFLRSKYAELKDVWAAIKPSLDINGLGIVQTCSMQPYIEVSQKEKEIRKSGQYEKLVWNGKWAIVKVREILITTMMVHSTGQWVKIRYLGTPQDNDDQARGATITYGRRYSLMCLCGISAQEDNDGNHVPVERKPVAHTVTAPSSPVQSKQNVTKSSFVVDQDGLVRYDKEKQILNDEHQKANGLIQTKELNVIMSLVKSELGGNILQFADWLKGVYGVKFYDIPTGAVAGIIRALEANPDMIMEYKKD